LYRGMKKCRILIVDDDAMLSRLVQAMIEKTGMYDTAVENLSYRALATARTFGPDLVLLDVDMPGKDGGDVAREMRADPALKSVPVIFLTALVSKHEAGMRKAGGAGERFVSKPTEAAVLLEAIEAVLASAFAAQPNSLS